MRILRALEPGTAIVIASVDPHNTPSLCRATALSSADAAATVTVYVPLATSQDVLRNIATTRRVAITSTNPLDHCSTQLKGVTIDARLARDDEAAFVRARRDAFADSLDAIGVPRRIGQNVNCWPAFAVTVRVDDVFDQTPGPNAGARLR
jgi:hypothetical protein